MDAEEVDTREAAFHGAVREYIICLLIFLLLYGLSYVIVRSFKKRADHDDLFGGDAEDHLVYRISVWICTFALSVSVAAVLLLPFSILGNEVLLRYPRSFYVQWLNSSLIQSLWNYVFLLSNLCLFVLLPFAYFFIESQGFSGLRKGIMTRVYESIAVCSLLLVVVFCLAHLISILLGDTNSRLMALFRIWNYQLPFIYSCVSFGGVVALLTCTPIGFVRMFSVVGDLVVKPRLADDLDADLAVTRLEEHSLQRKLVAGDRNGYGLLAQLGCAGLATSASNGTAPQPTIAQQLSALQQIRLKLERRKRSLRWLENLKFPLVMLLLLALTGISVLMVVSNTFQLLVGFRSLPSYKANSELGHTSLSALGWFGAALEMAIIFYTMLASVVGLYSAPVLWRLRPRWRQTSMTKSIGNATALLVLSSALPVLSRTLGITTFDLLGAYGKLDWLGNFYLIWSYNVLFAGATALCIVTKFSAAVRRALLSRFNEASQRLSAQRSSDCSSAPHLKTD